MLTTATTWTCTFEAVIASSAGRGRHRPHRRTQRGTDQGYGAVRNRSDQMQRSTGEPCRGCRRRGHARQSVNVSSPSVVVGACDAALRSTAFGAVSATHRACEQNHANGPTLDESTTAHMARLQAGPKSVVLLSGLLAVGAWPRPGVGRSRRQPLALTVQLLVNVVGSPAAARSSRR